MTTTIEKGFHDECKLRAKARRVSKQADDTATPSVPEEPEAAPLLVAGGLRVATAATATGTKRPVQDVVGEGEDSAPQPKRSKGQAGLEVCLEIEKLH